MGYDLAVCYARQSPAVGRGVDWNMRTEFLQEPKRYIRYDSLVVLGDLALGIFFKMVIMRGISGAACLGAARWCDHMWLVHLYARADALTCTWRPK